MIYMEFLLEVMQKLVLLLGVTALIMILQQKTLIMMDEVNHLKRPIKCWSYVNKINFDEYIDF